MLLIAIQTMELIVILTIFHNVIFQMDIIVLPGMKLIWLILHIVYQ
jgi:hypothetical protein